MLNVKSLVIWIKHTEDHALNYRNWTEKAKANGKSRAAGLLEEAADMSPEIDETLHAAPAAIDEG